VSGWQDVLFRCSPVWIESQRALDRRTLSTPLEIDGLPPGIDAVLVRREDVRDVPPEWLSLAHLRPDEERTAPEFAERDPRLRTSWLLGRIAAKDAARRWLAERNGTGRMLHPTRVVVANDDAGRPYIPAGGGTAVPAISLAHGQAGAVAVAAERAVGIDMEAADAGSRLVLDDFAAERERAILDKLPGAHGDPVRVTRLWCAKEAAAKALGRGLGGRPKQFEAVEADGSGRLWIRHGPTGQEVEVSTTLRAGLLIAVGTIATSVGVRPSFE
jgi:phosphopantetheinyl transferase